MAGLALSGRAAGLVVAAAVCAFPLLLRSASGGGAGDLFALVPGLVGLLWLYILLCRIVSRSSAAWATILLLYGSSLYGPWTGATDPRQTSGFLLAAGALAVWWDGRASLSTSRASALGALIGAASIAQGPNAFLLLLPALSPLSERPASRWSAAKRALATLGSFALVAAPGAIFGAWEPRFRHGGPDLEVALFSSVRGFLYWAPLAWVGFAGCASLWPRDGRTAGALILTLLAMAGAGCWIADPRVGVAPLAGPLDATWPLIGLGLGLAIERARSAVARRPGSALAVAGAALVLWNFLLMQQYRAMRIPRDGTVSFARVAGHSADTVARLVGTPMACPANWVFAARHGLPVRQFDSVVGARIFAGGRAVIDLGDDRVDPGLLGEGWLRRSPCEGGICREVSERSRILAPLAVVAPLDVTVRARGRGTLRLAVNGSTVAAFPLSPSLREHGARVAAHLWRRGVNEIGLSVGTGDTVSVDLVTLDRRETRP
jgi:hypothetical protein